jgi:hypothetical protein
MMRKMSVRAAVGLLLAAVCGCQNSGETRYGGYPVETKLESTPSGMPAYLIDYGDWNKAGGLLALDKPATIEGHSVGTTPVTKPLRKMRYVYVVKINGKYQHKEILPGEMSNTFSIP